ncbi:MAG TPA: SH3 domain-containing protein [Aggregatilineales bacterium]|nr:SH3 domain-containing protein [Aggregatilineales bacterium]
MRRWLASVSILIVLVGLVVVSRANAQSASATAGPGGANAYAGPGLGFWIKGPLGAQETVPVFGVTADKLWWQVNTRFGMAYVSAGDVTVQNGAGVPVIDPGPIGTVTAGVLTVRRGPGIGAARIGLIASNTQFFLLATQENSNWIKIRCSFGVGWINASQTSLAASVAAMNAAAAPPATPGAVNAPVATSAFSVPVQTGPRAIINTAALNVHTGPGTSFKVIGTLSGGDVVPIVGQTPDGTWVLVNTVFGQGWINFGLVIPKDYFGNAPVVVVSATAEKEATVIVLTGTVNVRSGPNIAFDSITTVNAGTHLPLLGQSPDGRWWYVDTPAGKGWIAKSVVEAVGAVSSVPVVH